MCLTWTSCYIVSSGERQRDVCVGQQMSPSLISPEEVNVVVVVAAVKSKATVITGRFGGVLVEIMLDSGRSISLVQHDVLVQAQDVVQVKARRPLQLMMASGEQLYVRGHIRAPFKIDELNLLHKFVVVESLVAHVILGVDFLFANALVLEFTQSPDIVCHSNPGPQPRPQTSSAGDQVESIYKDKRTRVKAGAIAAFKQSGTDIIDECAVPAYHKHVSIELPECAESHLYQVVEEYKDLFCTRLSVIQATCHFIPTTGNPVKVPPRWVPTHYQEEVNHQIQTMLEHDITEEISSPCNWMAPAVVFGLKKSGDLCMCIDYCELNKRLKKMHILCHYQMKCKTNSLELLYSPH